MMTDLERYQQYADRVPLFKGLTASEVADIIPRGEVMDVEQGKTIFIKGTRGNALYIVLRGVVDIFNDEFLIAQCQIGDAFGEVSAIDHRPHTASAIASTDVQMLVLAEEELNEILHQRVAVRLLLNVIHLLSGYLADTNTHVALLENKVARYEHSRVGPRT